MINKRIFKILLIALSLTILISGCNLSHDFRTFKLTRGVGHFLFEYPTQYHVGKIEVKPDYSDINFDGRSPEKDGMSTSISLLINY